MAPVASIIKILLERRCIPVSRLPVFDTTSPDVGVRLKPRIARHGNFTPPRFSPSRPQAEISLRTDEVMAKQLVQLFCGRMGTALHLTLAIFYAEIPHRWSWRILQSRSAPSGRLVRERISVAGRSIFKVQRCLSASARRRTLSEDTVHHDQIVARQGRFQSLEQFFLPGGQRIGIGMKPICQFNATTIAASDSLERLVKGKSCDVAVNGALADIKPLG